MHKISQVVDQLWRSGVEESVQRGLAEAIENTSERIDVVGERLAQLGDRARELLPLLGVAFVTVLVFC